MRRSAGNVASPGAFATVVEGQTDPLPGTQETDLSSPMPDLPRELNPCCESLSTGYGPFPSVHRNVRDRMTPLSQKMRLTCWGVMSAIKASALLL